MAWHKNRGLRTLVDRRPAGDYARNLHAKGMSYASMARQSGVSERVLHGLVEGWVPEKGGRRPVERCSTETEAKVFGIRFRADWRPDGFSPEKFRGLRESRGLARYALAKAAGLCPETIQFWENGRSLPKRKKNIDTVLALLGAEWSDVSGPLVDVEEESDEFSMVFFDGVTDSLDDEVPDYPCLVCGGIFRSRLMLASHPHPKKKVSV